MSAMEAEFLRRTDSPPRAKRTGSMVTSCFNLLTSVALMLWLMTTGTPHDVAQKR